MRFNPRARLDSSQVRVRRGGGGGGFGGGFGGGRSGAPGGLKVGGLGGVILVIVIFVASQLFGGGGTTVGSSPFGIPLQGLNSGDSDQIAGAPDCQTGADANRDELCAMVASINSIQAMWQQLLPRATDVAYVPAQTEFFQGRTTTGCGPADSSVGPFYCPADSTVYLDRSFFAEMLQGQLGARGGTFAAAYVLAHEYGHHIQNLTGDLSRKLTQGAEGGAVRLELQADCYAGMWARFATEIKDANGEVLIESLTQEDIDLALDAAAAVGDDRIQKRSGGRIDPDTWTHGSARARQHWFGVGFNQADVQGCNTFQARDLEL